MSSNRYISHEHANFPIFRVYPQEFKIYAPPSPRSSMLLLGDGGHYRDFCGGCDFYEKFAGGIRIFWRFLRGSNDGFRTAACHMLGIICIGLTIKQMSKKPASLAIKAAEAESTVKSYLNSRKEILCRAADRQEFEDKGMSGFVYTRDHCRSKAAKGKGKARRGNNEDAKEIAQLEKILENQYPVVEGKNRVPASERSVIHEQAMLLTSMMLMPFYRMSYPDPEDRYTELLKRTKIKKSPRFRVLSNVLMTLKALNADPDREGNVRLTAEKTRKT